MNGLPQTDNRSSHPPSEAFQGEQFRSLVRNAAKDAKVTFGAFRGTFDLNRHEIGNFFHLIDQRVSEQNGCSASFCEFAVYYNNGTSRKFPGIDDFNGYTETRNRFPTVVTLHLVYFISFPESEAPEKQEVDIVIRASESTKDTIDIVTTDSRMRMSGDKIQLAVSEDNRNLGLITYTINHSKISWGLDLEGHIQGHIETLLTEPSKAERFLQKSAGPLDILTTIFCGLYIVNLIIDFFFKFLYKTDGAQNSADVLALAAEYLVNGQIAKYIVASLVVSVVFFVIFSAFISSITKSIRRPKPSFIALNEADLKRRDRKFGSYKKRWTRFGAMVLLNLVVAIMVTFLEDRIAFAWNNWSGFLESDESSKHDAKDPEAATESN